MTFKKIREMPTSLGKAHESLLRSYQIMQCVKEMLTLECPADILLLIIDDLESAPHSELVP